MGKERERERELYCFLVSHVSQTQYVMLQSDPSKAGTWLLLDASRVYWSGFGQCWREFCKFEYHNTPSRVENLSHLKGVLEVFANWLGASLAQKTLASEKLPDKNGSCRSCGRYSATCDLDDAFGKLWNELMAALASENLARPFKLLPRLQLA